MTTESKFTPGPWVAEPQGGRGSWIKGSTGEWAALSCGYTDERSEANARLIAAAPDLFAFAECSAAIDCARADPRYDAKPVLRSHAWKGEENPSVFLARIRRAAIEKAVGHYLGHAA